MRHIIKDVLHPTLLELYEVYGTGAAAVPTDTVADVLGRPGRSWEDFIRENSGSF